MFIIAGATGGGLLLIILIIVIAIVVLKKKKSRKEKGNVTSNQIEYNNNVKNLLYDYKSTLCDYNCAISFL